MIAKSWRAVLAGVVAGCLVLLTVHDLARVHESNATPCQVCALVARTATHAPKAAPVVVSRAVRVAIAPEISLRFTLVSLVRADARAPPQA